MEFELLHEAENENIDKLFDLYKRDPFKASG